MKSKQWIKPTDAELEILQVLWSHGPCTVRFVNGHLNVKKRVGYTTTLKFMQIMTEKNMLGRNEKSRTHIYRPLIAKEETQNLLLDKFLLNAFGGSAMKLVMQALGNHQPTQEELDEIKAYIKKVERSQK
ncbi:MAG: BlaI/MecI/CopY family transcriptional regulator [Bacteroidales bacterium]|nr:BlaI/MecI/CopY family transcriptional regulator [Bacteroidales bacterium]